MSPDDVIRVRVPGGGDLPMRDGGDIDLHTEDLRDSRGVRVDESAVEVTVDRIEKSPRRGRPPLSGRGAGVSPTVRARMPHSMYRRLHQVADLQRRSESDVVRDAVEEYLARHPAG